LFDDVGADFEEVAFVLDGDEGFSGAVIHGDLQGLNERADGLGVTPIPKPSHIPSYPGVSVSWDFFSVGMIP
jgi:hypothetical protein